MASPPRPGGRDDAPRRAKGPAAGRSGHQRALGRVDGPRGQRDGAELTARRARNRTRRRLVAGVVTTVLLVGVAFVAVFPTRPFLAQRAATRQTEAELRDLRAQRTAVQRETARSATTGEIERRAREDFGYVKPGEEAYNILPGRTQPIGLPDEWPFNGLERVLGAG